MTKKLPSSLRDFWTLTVNDTIILVLVLATSVLETSLADCTLSTGL